MTPLPVVYHSTLLQVYHTKVHHGFTSDHTAYRCLRKIGTGAFKQDLSHCSISDYNNHLCSVLDQHAPLGCRRTVRTRKPTPWFSSIAEQFCELKWERRQAERRWLKSKFTVHKQIYIYSIKQKVTNLVDKANQVYYSAKIQSSKACKQLF